MPEFEPGPTDYDYHAGKLPDRVYISRPFRNDDFSAPGEDRPKRILSKVFISDESNEFVSIRDQIRLHISPGERQELKVVFYDDTRDILRITFQKFMTKSGEPVRHSISFTGDEITRLLGLLQEVPHLRLRPSTSQRLDDRTLMNCAVRR